MCVTEAIERTGSVLSLIFFGSVLGIFTLGHFMRLSVNVLQDATQVFRQSDCMDRCKYRVKQHSGLLSGQPGVCDIIIPLVMQEQLQALDSRGVRQTRKAAAENSITWT